MTVEQHGPVTLHHGDCLDVLRGLPDASVDAVVTDPPYGLGFMGREWDALPPGREWAEECLRVLKPGGHMLAFGGTRTWHRLACAVEDAGFEVRDSIAWLYGSGFPKSLDVAKAIDKRGGKPHLAAEIGAAIKAARETRGWTTAQADRHFCGGSTNWTWFEGRKGECRPPTPATFARIVAEWPELARWAQEVAEADRQVIGSGVSGIGTAFGDGEWSSAPAESYDVTAPATEAAQAWEGWGTALKPAFEPVVVARKPLAGTVAANVLAHGTGALNIDGCRLSADGDTLARKVSGGGSFRFDGFSTLAELEAAADAGGRTPTGCNARATLARYRKFAEADRSEPAGRWPANVVLDAHQAAALDRDDDDGGASRFFYTAKAPSSERVRVDGTAHPTVKPLDLMRWLVRLVTPPGGTVLEPFAGSGTTVEACLLEGFACVAIEREADYLPLIRQRINRRRDPVAATRAARAAGDDPDLFDLLA